MINSLIFGANGQDAFYLGKLLEEHGIDSTAVARTGAGVRGDVSDYALVTDLIKGKKPDYIFHLAANSTTSHEALFENNATISTGTLNILEAAKKHCPKARVFITGSGVQFHNHGLPISEKDEFDATSAYAVARIHAVYAARYYRTLGIRAYVGYLFHHESPLRKERHISKKIALAVQRIASGCNEIVELGDISVKKEWTFAGDIAKAIFTLVNQDDIFEATLGSGKAYSIEEWLDYCFRLINKEWRQYVRLLEKFTPEYKLLVSDPATINALGWYPSVNIADLAEMMVSAK